MSCQNANTSRDVCDLCERYTIDGNLGFMNKKNRFASGNAVKLGYNKLNGTAIICSL